MGRLRPLPIASRGILLLIVAMTATPASSGQDAADPETRDGRSEGSEAAIVGPGDIEIEGEAPELGTRSVATVIRDANPMLIPLVLCSVATIGFALERLVALRRGRVIPSEFVDRFLERLASGKLDRDRAAEICRAHESTVARIFGHAIRYWGQPATAIRQAVDAESASDVADMKRNVRVLNGTATLAPLLGLLGTVVGLIESFDALGGSTAQGSGKGEALAHGISLALVATAFGLVVAVVSVICYYVLLNRVDVLVRELDGQVRKVIELVASDDLPGANRDGQVGLTPAERQRNEPRVS